jgi:hypothetical protein
MSLTEPDCEVVGDDVVVGLTIGRGPEFDESFDLGVRGWEPDSIPSVSSLPADDPSVEIGDRVTLGAPSDRVDEIDGVEMFVWRGEPGDAQTIPVTVSVRGDECALTVG